jgi:hypothetical protein
MKVWKTIDGARRVNEWAMAHRNLTLIDCQHASSKFFVRHDDVIVPAHAHRLFHIANSLVNPVIFRDLDEKERCCTRYDLPGYTCGRVVALLGFVCPCREDDNSFIFIVLTELEGSP